MEPLLRDGDYVLVDNLTVLVGDIQKGDVVVSRSPQNPLKLICKRVVAVDGDLLKTGYFSAQHVPKGHVWLEGDNRTESHDSRAYGPVPKGLITGRVFMKIYPLDEALKGV
jgi:inner membrane protease subunit 1